MLGSIVLGVFTGREYVLGEMVDNEHILIGRYIHRNVNQEGVRQEGDILCHRQQWVWSDRLEIKGIIDLVEEQDEKLVPVEYKKDGRNRRPPRDPVNALLSFAYGLLRVQVTAAVHIAGLDPYSVFCFSFLDLDYDEYSRIFHGRVVRAKSPARGENG